MNRTPMPRIAYLMSRFPKLTETFVMYEIIELERRGIPIEIYPLLRERTSTVHPEAAALVTRAHFRPFVSLEIVRENWHIFRRSPGRYLRVLGEVLRGTWGSFNLHLMPESAIILFQRSTPICASCT